MVEYCIGLPPPMVFRLSEFGFSIMAIKVWPVRIEALESLRSKKFIVIQRKKIVNSVLLFDLLVFLCISGAVIR